MAIKGFLEPNSYTVVDGIMRFQPKDFNLQFNIITYKDDTKTEKIHEQYVRTMIPTDPIDDPAYQAVFNEFFGFAKMDGIGENIIKSCYLWLKGRPGFGDGKTTDV